MRYVLPFTYPSGGQPGSTNKGACVAGSIWLHTLMGIMSDMAEIDINSCLVNTYMEGDGISPHWDAGEPDLTDESGRRATGPEGYWSPIMALRLEGEAEIWFSPKGNLIRRELVDTD